MGSSVDNRIVILTFDNKNFETNANQSIQTLDKLKKGLKLEDSSRGLDSLSKKAKTFNLDGMNDAIDSVNHRFSSLGVVGATVLSELTKTAMGLGSKLISGLTEPLIHGGWKRALNIEQAKFQLEGLGVDFKKITDDINWGVKDTAYGFDAAARAASQLSASGIQVGEEMKYSLRGISGVAAMTSSSYEEIAQIFARVAGQGRVMAVDLNSIAARGLNAAAALGKALNKSEEEIRDMVRHGEIDFRTFAKAMDDAFGEHAKDANKTFSGSLANVKAALSRIGADVAANSLTNLRDIFNALRPLIDNVHEALGPFIERINKLSTLVSEKLVKFINFLNSKTPAAKKNTKEVQNAISELAEHGFKDFDKLAKGFGVTEAELKDMVDGGRVKLDKFVSVMDEVFGKDVPSILDKFRKKEKETKETTEETADAIAKSAEDIDAMAKRVIQGEFGNGVDIRRQKLEELGYSFELVQNKVNELVGCDYRYEVSAEAVAESSEEASESVDELSESVDWLNKKQEETKLSNIQIALKNLGSAAKTVGSTFVNSFKEVFSKNSFSSDIHRLGKNFKDLTQQFVLNEDASRGLSVIWKGLFTLVKGIIKGLGWVVTFFMKVGQAIAFVIRKLIEFVGRFDKWLDDTGRKSRILEALGGVIRKIGEIIVAFKNKVVEVAKAIAKTEGFQIFVKAMKALWEVIKNVVGRIIDSVISGMERFGKWKPNFSWMDRLVDVFGKIFGAIGKFIMAVIKGEHPVRNFFDRLSQGTGVGAKFLSFLKTIGGGLANFFKNLKLPDKAKDLFGAIKDALTGGFEKLKSNDFLKSIIDLFKNSWDKLKELDWEKLTKAALKVVTFIQTMRYVNSLIKLNKNVQFKFNFNLPAAFKQLRKRDFAAKMRDFALGVGILAGALYLISKIPLEDVGRSVNILFGIIGVLAAVAIVLDKFTADGKAFSRFAVSMVPLGLGLLLLAGAIKIFSMMKPETFKKGATAVLGCVIILAAAARLAGKGGFGSFAGMALAILVLVPAIGILGKMKKKTLEQGVGTIMVVVTGLALASRIAGRSSFGTLVGMGLAVLLLVPSIFILGKMKTKSVIQGVAAITAVVIALGGASRLAKGIKLASLLGMAAFIVTLTASLYVLSKLDTKSLISSAIGMSAVITAVGISMRLLKKMESGPMIERALAMSILIGALAGAFALLAYLNADKVLEQAIGMSAVIVALGVCMKLLKNKTGVSSISAKQLNANIKAMVLLIASLAGAFALLAVVDADNVIQQAIGMSAIVLALSATLKILETIKPEGLLGKVGVLALLLASLTAAFAVLSYFKNDSVLEQALALSAVALSLTGALVLMSVFPLTVPGAINGVAAFEVFLWALIGTLSLIGKIDEWTDGGFSMVIEGGGNVLAKVGEAIGKFVGSIKAGYLESSSKAMPAVAENMSAFAEKMGPFLDFATKIDDSVLETMGTLASIVTMFSASTLTDSFSRILSFGKDPYEQIGESMCTFADYVVQFSNKITGSGLDTESVTAAANASKAVAEFANAIPRESGGVFDAFLGEKTSLTDFGEQMIQFADQIILFGSKVHGNISKGTIEDINRAKDAGMAVIEMANAIPNEGGLVGLLAGNNNLDTWSKELPKFAEGIISFASSVRGQFSDLTIESIEQATKAGTAIAKMGDEIPNSGISLLAAIIGDNDLGLWSMELPLFADGIIGFAAKVRGNFSEMTVADIQKATAAAVALAEMAKEIPNSGGLLGFFAGSNDLDDWGSKLPTFGQGIAQLGAALQGNISDQRVQDIGKAVTAAESLADLSTRIPDADGFLGWFGNTDLANFGTQLPLFGQGIAGFAAEISSASFDKSKVEQAISVADVASSFYTKLSGVDTGGSFFDFWKAGPLTEFGADLIGFGTAISSFGANIKGVNTNDIATVMDAIKPTLDTAVEINGTPYENFEDFGTALENFGKSIGKYADNVNGVDTAIIADVVKGIEPLVTLSSSINGASYNNLTEFVKNLGDFGTNLKTFSSSMKSVDTGKIGQIIPTVYDLINMAVQMKVVSPSSMSGFGNALAECGNKGVDAFIRGFEDAVPRAYTAGLGVTSSAYRGITSASYGAWYSAGQQAVYGFCSGMTSLHQYAYRRGMEIGNAALNGAKRALDEHSPSKAMEKIGVLAGQGLLNGLTKMEDSIYSAGESSGDTILNAVRNPLTRIKSLLDDNIDLNPVITPVLDLSNVAPGAKTLGSMFSGRNAYFGITGLGYANMAAAAFSGSKIDGSQQLASAISSLKDQPSSYTFNITVDGAESPENFANRLVRALKTKTRS